MTQTQIEKVKQAIKNLYEVIGDDSIVIKNFWDADSHITHIVDKDSIWCIGKGTGNYTEIGSYEDMTDEKTEPTISMK